MFFYSKINVFIIYGANHKNINEDRPILSRLVKRGGEGGKVFPGPATFEGPRQHTKMLKRVFQAAFFSRQVCIKSIFGRASAPDPTGELTTLPRPL